MNTPRRASAARTIGLGLGAALALVPGWGPARGQAGGPRETLERADGTRARGTLAGDGRGGFVFRTAEGSSEPVEAGAVVRAEASGPPAAEGAATFRVEVGGGERLSGAFVSADDRSVVLRGVAGRPGAVSVARGGARALTQRPGETLVLVEPFENLDEARWRTLGEPSAVDAPGGLGRPALRLPSGVSAVTYRLPDAAPAGRVEVAYYDDGRTAADQSWFVDLTFRVAAGDETVRAVLGWADDSPAVEAPRGPTMAVQRLSRVPGWHRLNFRFGPERCEVGVDGDELAHGRGVSGPLAEVKLATFTRAKAEPPEGLAAFVDDLKVVRSTAPTGEFEVEPGQDEARLEGGDQLFGVFRGADREKVRFAVDGRDVALPWSRVWAVHFRREPKAGAAVSGLITRVEWRGSPDDDPDGLDRAEGALIDLTPDAVRLATPYCGVLDLPRARVTALRFFGRATRLVLDNAAHHLGDSVSTTPPRLDPPQPEGGVLTRAFDLDAVPEADPRLAVDVVQVVGESPPDLPFAQRVKKGELRTNVSLNGTPFDYLNRYVHSRNETPERVLIPLPRKLLRAGANTVRFEQTGIVNDPNWLDDLGVLAVALETDAPALNPPAPPR